MLIRCGDCIHADVCKKITGWFSREDIANCKGFKDRNKYVEVVRCKDCKHYDNSEGIQWCHLNSKFAQWGTDWHSFPEDGFCSYGEKREESHQSCTYYQDGHCIGQKLMPECDPKNCDRRK